MCFVICILERRAHPLFPKFQKDDISVDVKSDAAVDFERTIASKRLKKLITDMPDVTPELEEESDGAEALGGSNEDPDIPREENRDLLNVVSTPGGVVGKNQLWTLGATRIHE